MFENILTNQTLVLNNVLIYRKMIMQNEAINFENMFREVITKCGGQLIGHIVTATHSIQMKENQPLMDIEFIIPIDKEIIPPKGFIFLRKFEILNSVKMRICGNSQLINCEMIKLNKFLRDNKLTPATPLYMITIEGGQTIEDMNNLIVETYIGISKN